MANAFSAARNATYVFVKSPQLYKDIWALLAVLVALGLLWLLFG